MCTSGFLCEFWGLELRSSCLLSKPFTDQAISSGLRFTVLSRYFIIKRFIYFKIAYKGLPTCIYVHHIHAVLTKAWSWHHMSWNWSSELPCGCWEPNPGSLFSARAASALKAKSSLQLPWVNILFLSWARWDMCYRLFMSIDEYTVSKVCAIQTVPLWSCHTCLQGHWEFL